MDIAIKNLVDIGNVDSLSGVLTALETELEKIGFINARDAINFSPDVHYSIVILSHSLKHHIFENLDNNALEKVFKIIFWLLLQAPEDSKYETAIDFIESMAYKHHIDLYNLIPQSVFEEIYRVLLSENNFKYAKFISEKLSQNYWAKSIYTNFNERAAIDARFYSLGELWYKRAKGAHFAQYELLMSENTGIAGWDEFSTFATQIGLFLEGCKKREYVNEERTYVYDWFEGEIPEQEFEILAWILRRISFFSEELSENKYSSETLYLSNYTNLGISYSGEIEPVLKSFFVQIGLRDVKRQAYIRNEVNRHLQIKKSW